MVHTDAGAGSERLRGTGRVSLGGGGGDNAIVTVACIQVRRGGPRGLVLPVQPTSIQGNADQRRVARGRERVVAHKVGVEVI